MKQVGVYRASRVRVGVLLGPFVPQYGHLATLLSYSFPHSKHFMSEAPIVVFLDWDRYRSPVVMLGGVFRHLPSEGSRIGQGTNNSRWQKYGNASARGIAHPFFPDTNRPRPSKPTKPETISMFCLSCINPMLFTVMDGTRTPNPKSRASVVTVVDILSE